MVCSLAFIGTRAYYPILITSVPSWPLAACCSQFLRNQHRRINFKL